MGDIKGFMKYAREGPKRKPVELRVLDWKEMYEPISEDKLKIQGARCMDCGVPFCQGNTGCPVVNSMTVPPTVGVHKLIAGELVSVKDPPRVSHMSVNGVAGRAIFIFWLGEMPIK